MRPRTTPASVSWMALGALLLFFLARPIPAQAQSSLDRIQGLAEEGRVSEARGLLDEWVDERFDAAGAAERQEALWLRGRLAISADEARRHYLRLVVEHPGGAHSADALLRLGQAEEARGSPAGAADYFEQILREYPESPRRLEARRWLDENRDAVARARATAAAGPADGGGGGSLDPASAQADAAAAGPATIQLGAFSSMDRAQALVRRAERAGVEGLRLVRFEGTDLVRVRAGRFSEVRAAVPLQGRIESLGFDAVIVTDADREVEIR